VTAPEIGRWPLEPEKAPSAATASLASPAPAPVARGRPPIISYERGQGVSALRRGPLEPRLLSGLPWLAMCVLSLIAWLIAGRGMAMAFILLGLVGTTVLVLLRLAERGVSVLHLWDRRQAARRDLGLPAPRLVRPRTRLRADPDCTNETS
jgi:hypothetical protein